MRLHRPPSLICSTGYAGRSSEVRIENGSISSTVTHSYTVVPRQAGTFVIPAITVVVNGQRLTSQPLRLTVLKPGAPPPSAINSGSQLAFLRLVLPQKEMYLGQIVPAKLELFVRGDVQGISGFQIADPPADGFIVGKFVQGAKYIAQVGNARYAVIPFSFTLKAIKTGPFKIGPVTATIALQVASRGRRRGSPFDDFGLADPFDMFGGGERKQLALATEAAEMQSLPLPSENVPPSFAGAVGSFTMTASAGPTNVAAGDPITVKVEISGRGALDALTLPEQTGWAKFKTYPPTAKVDKTDVLGLEGTKSFEQVVVPQSADIKELPPLAFSFFDPEKKQYRTITQPAVALVVRPSGPAAVPSVAAANQNTPNAPAPTRDIVHIKPRSGTLAQIGVPLLQRPWFLSLQMVPLLAWLAALSWRKRHEILANNPRLRRRRDVAQLIRSGCARLRELAAANRSDEFFATLFRLMQEQLGERLDLPASAITEAVVEERLRPRNVPEDLLNRVRELFQACNLARYARGKTSQELAAFVPQFESALGQIRQLRL